jgi:hypothetical protein
VTTLAGKAYWLMPEQQTGHFGTGPGELESATLQGGSTSTLGTVPSIAPGVQSLGATSSTVFYLNPAIHYFPIASPPAMGVTPPTVPGMLQCDAIVSDTDAVYCQGTSVFAIANNGTVTTLGPILQEGETGNGLTFDDLRVLGRRRDRGHHRARAEDRRASDDPRAGHEPCRHRGGRQRRVLERSGREHQAHREVTATPPPMGDETPERSAGAKWDGGTAGRTAGSRLRRSASFYLPALQDLIRLGPTPPAHPGATSTSLVWQETKRFLTSE